MHQQEKRVFLDVPVNSVVGSGVVPIGTSAFRPRIKLGQELLAARKITLERYVIKFHGADSTYALPDTGYFLMSLQMGHTRSTSNGVSAVRGTTATEHELDSSSVPILITPNQQTQVSDGTHPPIEFYFQSPARFDSVVCEFHFSKQYQAVLDAASKIVGCEYMQLWLTVE